MGPIYIRGFVAAAIWAIVAIVAFSAGKTTLGLVPVGLAVVAFIVGLIAWRKRRSKGATPK